MNNLPYASSAQIFDLLSSQDYKFTSQQITENVFEDGNGDSYRIRKGVIDDCRMIASNYFSKDKASKIVSALDSLEPQGKGPYKITRERLLLEKTRCYVVSTQKQTVVPTGKFFNLRYGSKVTCTFHEDKIVITPHK